MSTFFCAFQENIFMAIPHDTPAASSGKIAL
jgi:hypothetical protein